ncbi:MAG: DNA primase, partial [Methanothrix sp.]
MTAEHINPEDIPEELRARAQWVLWKYEGRGDHETKVPYQVNGYGASTKLESSWVSFDEVLQIYNTVGGYSGVAYVLAKKDPFVGIDLDDCI